LLKSLAKLLKRAPFRTHFKLFDRVFTLAAHAPSYETVYHCLKVSALVLTNTTLVKKEMVLIRPELDAFLRLLRFLI